MAKSDTSPYAGMTMPWRNKVPESVSAETPQAKALQRRRVTEEIQRRAAEHPSMGAPDPRYRPLDEQRTTLPAKLASMLPDAPSRDVARMALHGLARTGNTILGESPVYTYTPAKIIIEDRQPDGTWAPAKDRSVDAETGEVVELPPPPPPTWMPDVDRPAYNVVPGRGPDGDWDARMAAKAGQSPDRFSMSRNFLATDKVPDSIFGIPVVADEGSWTPEDLEFFKEHPEAGGYYDMGEGTPEDGTEEGEPVQADEPKRGKYPGIANNPGNVEKHERRTDKTLFKGEIGGGKRPKRFANFTTPVDGLNAAALTIMRRAADLAKDGKDFTIGNYAPLYAPPTENDTARYTRNLSRYSGIPADEVLDPGNAEQMASLLRNVVRFESGYPHSEWFTDDEYAAAAAAGLMKEGPKTSAPSLPAGTDNHTASGGSTQSHGKRKP